MIARPLAVLGLSLLGALTLSCSSSTTQTTSGGAYFETSGGSSCPDPNVQVLIAVKGEDGSNKLISDGADGAHVSCNIDDTHFSVAAQNASGAITATGTLTNGVARNVVMRFQVASALYIGKADQCHLTILENGGGKFRAKFTCDQVDHSSLPNKSCALTSGASFFSFAGCGGF